MRMMSVLKEASEGSTSRFLHDSTVGHERGQRIGIQLIGQRGQSHLQLLRKRVLQKGQKSSGARRTVANHSGQRGQVVERGSLKRRTRRRQRFQKPR